MSGEIPVLSIEGENIPEAWEKAVLAVWDNGLDVKTEYDKPEDPPSKDATVIVTVQNPFAEPRIHKNFPGGPEELEAYRQEVVMGIHDHWINPSQGKWTYTYHERLFAFSPTDDLRGKNRPFASVDQIEYIVEKLAKDGHSRRAQAVTWMQTADPQTNDPPCLQRIWCRLTPDNDGTLALNMNTHWRSRDLYKAWFMNVYAITDLQRTIAEKIQERMQKEGKGDARVRVGRYVDICDSLHIYGSYFAAAAPEIEKMRRTPYTNRAWESTHPAFQAMTQEAREKLSRDPDCYAKGKG